MTDQPTTDAPAATPSQIANSNLGWGKFHPKTTASVLAMAMGTLLVDALTQHGIPLTAGDSAAIITLLGFGCSYIAPSE